ncbi:hypothetical protein [Natronomonas sp.]|uniref:hypothetical protein n=1 Tax=Natronomonas sp. TaxID=2184060 RepID=UPI0039758367
MKPPVVRGWLRYALVVGALAAIVPLADGPRPDRQVLVIVFLVAFGVGAAIGSSGRDDTASPISDRVAIDTRY